jgi:hypothetical protein
VGVAEMPAEAAARAAELLDAEPGPELLARLEELGRETPGGALALVEALGSERSEAAGRVLGTLAAEAPGKDVRKAARRGIHRLRAAGVAVELPAPSSAPAPIRAEGPVLTDAYATAIDGIGSRAVWLALERPLGGLASFGLLLNDIVGMKDCTFRETTRKKLRETLRAGEEERGLRSVEIPPEYALSLVSEALALNAESGFAVPTEFQLHRALLGELPPPPEQALIHRHISRGQALLLPNLLEESAKLLDERELRGWFFGYDESLARAHERQRVRESRIVLTNEPPEERERRVVDAAIGELFTPNVRRAMRRRLEEMAYIFWRTGRERPARLAVAAAFAIGDGPLNRHPFARALVEKSLELALEAERSGMDPAMLRRDAYTPVDEVE